MTLILDASVLIAYASSHDEHHLAAKRILKDWVQNGYATPVLTLAEFFVGPALGGQLEAAQHLIARLGVRALEIPSTAAIDLARIRAQSRLKMPDACVLYAARESGSALATFDARLRTAAALSGIRYTSGGGE